MYDVNKLRLIFYDNPFWGPYRPHFARIFAEPRYNDLRANLRHFAAIYETILQRNGTASGRRQGGVSGAPAQFEACYHQYIAREAERVSEQLESLDHTTKILEDSVS